MFAFGIVGLLLLLSLSIMPTQALNKQKLVECDNSVTLENKAVTLYLIATAEDTTITSFFGTTGLRSKILFNRIKIGKPNQYPYNFATFDFSVTIKCKNSYNLLENWTTGDNEVIDYLPFIRITPMLDLTTEYTLEGEDLVEVSIIGFWGAFTNPNEGIYGIGDKEEVPGLILNGNCKEITITSK
jgi:hypothetical protein